MIAVTPLVLWFMEQLIILKVQYGRPVKGPIVKVILSDVLPYLGVSKREGGIYITYTIDIVVMLVSGLIILFV